MAPNVKSHCTNPNSIIAQVEGSGTEPTAVVSPLNPLLPKSVLPLDKSPNPEQSFEIVLVSIVTAACSAIARPHRMLAPVFNVML